MLGSLMMLASGRIASWPSSASSSLIFCAGVNLSGKLAMIRPVSEMSFSFIFTPAVPTKASTIGRRENVASAGASSTFVQMISRSDMLAPRRAAFVSAELSIDDYALSCRSGVRRRASPEVVLFQIDVEVGQDQLVLDEAPHDAGHLVAVEFDDGLRHLDFCHRGH